MKENWRDVVGYEGLYEVSSLGRVRSYHGGKASYRKCCKDKNGYMSIVLSKNGKIKNFLVHRLIWEAFNSPVPSGMQLDHINTVRDDNRIENLRVVSARENHRNPITAERMKESNRRLAKDPEWRHRQREGAKRRSENQEWREKMREVAKKRSENPQWRNGVRRARAKAVLQISRNTGEVIRRWESMKDVEFTLGIASSSISNCCHGKRSVAGGFKWKFA